MLRFFDLKIDSSLISIQKMEERLEEVFSFNRDSLKTINESIAIVRSGPDRLKTSQKQVEASRKEYSGCRLSELRVIDQRRRLPPYAVSDARNDKEEAKFQLGKSVENYNEILEEIQEFQEDLIRQRNEYATKTSMLVKKSFSKFLEDYSTVNIQVNKQLNPVISSLKFDLISISDLEKSTLQKSGTVSPSKNEILGEQVNSEVTWTRNLDKEVLKTDTIIKYSEAMVQAERADMLMDDFTNNRSPLSLSHSPLGGEDTLFGDEPSLGTGLHNSQPHPLEGVRQNLTSAMSNKSLSSFFGGMFRKKEVSIESQVLVLLKSIIAGDEIKVQDHIQFSEWLDSDCYRDLVVRYLWELSQNPSISPITKIGLTQIWKVMLDKCPPQSDWKNLSDMILFTQKIEQEISGFTGQSQLGVVKSFEDHVLFKKQGFWVGCLVTMVINDVPLEKRSKKMEEVLMRNCGRMNQIIGTGFEQVKSIIEEFYRIVITEEEQNKDLEVVIRQVEDFLGKGDVVVDGSVILVEI